MRWREKPKINVEVRLPGITIGVDDITAAFGSKRQSGPFLIVSRGCGMALDTGGDHDNGSIARACPMDARRRQLWYLEPTGHDGEMFIVSADNRLVLDATRPHDQGKPLLWERHARAAWQRWTLDACPDGAAYYVGSVAHERVLVMSEDAEPGWQPWLEDRRGVKSHQWMFVVPHGDGLA